MAQAQPGTPPLMRVEQFTPVVDGLDHPEGVTWGPDGFVYAGGEAGQVYRVDLDGGTTEQLGSTGGFILGLCLDADRAVYACDKGKRVVARMSPSGDVTTYANGTAERAMVTPNYAAFAAGGILYVSDSGTWRGNDGCLWLVRPGGETELASIDLRAFPNGLALSPDGSELYVVLSNLPGVARVPIDAGGRLGAPQVAAHMPRTVPDGLAFDEQGDLYIACYTPDVIYRLGRDGALDVVVEDWESTTLSSPTNIAFCGPDRRTLVAASLSRWHLARATMPVAGAPLNYPRLR